MAQKIRTYQAAIVANWRKNGTIGINAVNSLYPNFPYFREKWLLKSAPAKSVPQRIDDQTTAPRGMLEINPYIPLKAKTYTRDAELLHCKRVERRAFLLPIFRGNTRLSIKRSAFLRFPRCNSLSLSAQTGRKAFPTCDKFHFWSRHSLPLAIALGKTHIKYGRRTEADAISHTATPCHIFHYPAAYNPLNTRKTYDS